MHWLLFLLFLTQVVSIPLQQSSLVTLRTTQSQPSAGGNNVLYKQLLLEEWSSSYQFLQSWSVPCSLPDISTESLTEGLLRSKYPYGDGVWFLCRDVPVGSNLSYTPAPVLIMNLQEDGNLIQWASDSTSYPPGTSANSVYSWYDSSVDNYVFYMLGGYRPPSPGNAPRPSQPRIRIDTGAGTPPDLQGALANIATNVNPTGLSIMTDSLYVPALIPNGTSLPFFSIYLVGTENTLPIAVRSVVSYAVFDTPQMLSVWTFPFVDTIWFTGFNRLPYLARTNFSVNDPAQMTMVFSLPSGSSSGAIGGINWRVSSARFEGNYFTTGETIYINNGTNILRNTVQGLTTGLPYQPTVATPQGWKFLDAHARSVSLPTPTPSATATSTTSPSSSATSTATSSPSASSSPSSSTTASATSTVSGTPTSSSSATSSPSPSASPSSTSTQQSPQPVPSSTPSPSPSNGSIPFQPDNTQKTSTPLTIAEQTGIGLGSIGVICVAALVLIHFNPSIKRLYIRKFGTKSIKKPKASPTVRNKILNDMPIVINHNPNILVQQRIQQLQQFSRLQVRENLEPTRIHLGERHKKQFAPVVGSSV